MEVTSPLMVICQKKSSFRRSLIFKLEKLIYVWEICSLASVQITFSYKHKLSHKFFCFLVYRHVCKSNGDKRWTKQEILRVFWNIQPNHAQDGCVLLWMKFLLTKWPKTFVQDCMSIFWIIYCVLGPFQTFYDVSNVMQMRKILCSSSFAFNTPTHEKLDVWNGPNVPK